MTVIEHLRHILDASIAEPLSKVGIKLTGDRSGYTVASYSGGKNGFDREVSVVRDKWWSKDRGRFTVFLLVARTGINKNNLKELFANSVQVPLADLMSRETVDWKIWSTDDALPFIEMLRNGIQEHGIPWLEQASELNGFAELRERYES